MKGSGSLFGLKKCDRVLKRVLKGDDRFTSLKDFCYNLADKPRTFRFGYSSQSISRPESAFALILLE